MRAWDEVRQDRELIAAIDWEMTPALAFEVFQLKSAEAWRHRGLDQAVYFYLSTWRGENRVYLVRRSLKESEELAAAPAPAGFAPGSAGGVPGFCDRRVFGGALVA
jgi:hypothetical protein